MRQSRNTSSLFAAKEYFGVSMLCAVFFPHTLGQKLSYTARVRVEKYSMHETALTR